MKDKLTSKNFNLMGWEKLPSHKKILKITMTDNGNKVKCMEKEYINGKIIQHIKVNMKMEKNRVLEYLFMLLETLMKDTGMMENKMVLEFRTIKKESK